MKKTIFDIAPNPVKSNIIHEINKVEDIFEAIKEELKHNNTAKSILVHLKDTISIGDLKNMYGFIVNYIYENNREQNYKELKFRGHTLWVYYRENEPVFFDDACSGTNTQPHTATFRSRYYDTLLFDKCEKITF